MELKAPQGVATPSQNQPVVAQGLGKEQFMQLLVAQLANQDPLNPLDDKEFIAQLAQFSSLEQQMATNKNLELLGVSQAAIANAQVTTLIGKEVTADSDSLQIVAGEPAADLRFFLDADAADVTISIRDEHGNAVRTLSAGGRNSGGHTLSWDGLNDTGQSLNPGAYTVEVEGVDPQGDAVSGSTRTRGIVTGVTFEHGYPELIIGTSRVLPGEVVEVSSTSLTSGLNNP